MGHGAGKFLKRTWATVDPVAAKALGADVSWKREALVNPVNAGLRKMTDDRVDLTSRESTEGAAQGAMAGSSAGPVGAIAGAVAGGLLGSVQHYQNVKNGVPRQGIFGMKPIDEEKVGGGGETLGGGGGLGVAKEADGGSSSKGGAEVYKGEAVGIGENPEVESAAEQRARIARGRFAGTGTQAFGFTQSERLGA